MKQLNRNSEYVAWHQQPLLIVTASVRFRGKYDVRDRSREGNVALINASPKWYLSPEATG